MRLGELIDRQTGVVLSRKQAEIRCTESIFKYPVFTLSSFTQVGLDKEQLGFFDSKEDVGEKYLSKEGDVIVRLSTPNYAILIDADTKGVLIPSQFLRVSITDERLIPEYLVIYLNSDEVRSQIEKLSIGTVIKVLKVSEFSDINIPLPSLREQEKIIRLHELIKRQDNIKKKLFEAEERRNKYYIEKLLRGVNNDN